MGYWWENQSKTYTKENRDDAWSPKTVADHFKSIPVASFRHAEPLCPFCWGNSKTRCLEIYNSVFAMYDEYPVTDSHVLILTKRHIENYFGMTAQEKMDCDYMIRILRRRISKDDPAVTGFNIGINSGKSAGQAIFHAHIHLIPRRDGDTPSPRGGVRGVIPEKMDY